jgi:hypothetical protein
MKVRFFGLVLMVISSVAIHVLYGLVKTGAGHEPTGIELVFGLTIVVTGFGGVLLAATGSELFRSPEGD